MNKFHEKQFTTIVEPAPEPILTVTNVVCGCRLGTPINLPTVAQALHASYEPQIFPAGVTRNYNTETASILFATGAVVIVGCSTEADGLLAAYELAEFLQSTLKIGCRVYNFKVCNIPCDVNLPWPINIALFWCDHKVGDSKAVYMPDRFPGMRWKTKVASQSVTFTLFYSGSGVVTGLKSLDLFPTIEELLRTSLYPYRLGHEYRDFTTAELVFLESKKGKAHKEVLDHNLNGIQNQSCPVGCKLCKVKAGKEARELRRRR